MIVNHGKISILKFTGEFRFLSNFYPVKITYEGLTYPSAENAYQAAKTLDLSLRKNFEEISSSDAKKLGRSIRKRIGWDDMKVPIMRDIVRIKFLVSDLQKMLLDTEESHLEEGNRWNDTFWGTCGGMGGNWLGKILMDVRGELRR